VDDAIKAVVLTGTGEKAFSAGADIKFLNQASPFEVRELAQMAVSVNHKIETLGKVVIAAMNGFALGGGLELAEACMLRVVVRNAMLGHPEVRIGAIAGFGGTTRLPRLIGKGRATELLLTGSLVTAEEGLKIGLVNRVVEPANLISETENLVLEIISQSPIAVRMTWEAIHRGMNGLMDRVLSEYRAGKPLFDVVLTNDTPMQIMEKQGILAKYASPSAKDFSASAIDPKLGPRYRNVIIGVVYNNSLVKPADAPKSLEDLLKSEFRGKVVMPDPTQHTTTAQWLASLHKLMGKEKAEKYVRDLAATHAVLVESLLPTAERVTTGEPRLLLPT
jgi:enoyl-CoA hydratase/carnithine racemase